MFEMTGAQYKGSLTNGSIWMKPPRCLKYLDPFTIQRFPYQWLHMDKTSKMFEIPGAQYKGSLTNGSIWMKPPRCLKYLDPSQYKGSLTNDYVDETHLDSESKVVTEI